MTFANTGPIEGDVFRMRHDWLVETFADVLSQAPSELRPWLLDFQWSREKLWSLPLEESEVSTQQLAWILELPWWRGTGGQVFTVRPIDVTTGPHYQRTAQANLSWPLHVTERHGRFLVLDGVHRLLKATWLGLPTLRVLDVPPDALREIAA